MRAIEQFQIRKIYAIGNALGIKASGNEDELHVLVGGVTGKESIKSLTYQEACAVIARLEELQGKTASPKPRSKKPKEHQSRPGGVTSGQQKKIWYLMYELKKYDEVPNDVQLGDRLCAVIKKEFGADAIAKNPFAWITFEQGNNLIEILKRWGTIMITETLFQNSAGTVLRMIWKQHRLSRCWQMTFQGRPDCS